MYLTSFEWTLVITIGSVLLAAISFLVGQMIRLFSQRVSEMATVVAEVSRRLLDMNEVNLREHADFAHADNVREANSKIFNRVEDIKNICTRIESKMVTQEQCLQRCANS